MRQISDLSVCYQRQASLPKLRSDIQARARLLHRRRLLQRYRNRITAVYRIVGLVRRRADGRRSRKSRPADPGGRPAHPLLPSQP